MHALAALLSLGPRFDAEADGSSATSVADARESLAFWRARRSRLPWHRRTERAEARTMVWRWRARLLHANLERRQLGSLALRLAPLLPGLRAGRGEPARRLGVLVLRRTVRRARRRLLVAAAATAVGGLAALALLVVVASQLL